MFGLGPTELFIIAIIILLIFGARRLPEIGKGLGGAVREFKKIKKDLSVSDSTAENENKEQASAQKGNTSFIEDKVKEKVLEQVPGVKTIAEVKKKAEQVKKIVE